MVGVVSGSLYRRTADSQPKSSGLVLGRRPLGAILHSSNEPGELSQRLCHDDSTINIVLVIIIVIIILKSFHWLKVNERIEYKLLSLTYKVLTTAQPSYFHNLISLQPPRSTRSSSVVTLSRSPTVSSLKITDRSFRYACITSSLEFGINFKIHSVSLTILVSIHPLIHFSTHLCHHPHSRHLSLLHSFTPGSKPTISTNLSHRRFLLPTGLPHDNGTGPDLSQSPFYF